METDVINKKIFRVENLNYYYPNDQIAALRELNFEVDQGEFILVIGRSGSGKSTLARVLSRLAPDFHGGTITGNITFKGEPLWQWNNRQLPAHIGIVFQEAEQQLLMSNVEREIAFGLENLGVAEPQMRRRVAEVMDFLNLNHLRKKPLAELSGGEKQKVALGGLLVMQPEVLILDEPTSQLDPTAAEDFINWIKKLNHELGLTVIMFEQRMDMLFPMVDRVMVLDGGKIIFDGLPGQQPAWAVQSGYVILPTLASLFANDKTTFPLTVKEARKRLEENITIPVVKKAPGGKKQAKELLLNIKNLTFNYPQGKEVIRSLNLQIYRGEVTALLGANGAGKTTLLRIIAGILKNRRGSIDINMVNSKDKNTMPIAFLPQQTEDFFLADTLEEDILINLPREKDKNEITKWLDLLGLESYRKYDPRKLSTGQKKRAALACLLASEPQLLLLDEPGTGMDQESKRRIIPELRGWCQNRQNSLVVVTHDMDFAGELADRVLFMHNGAILADEPVTSAFKEGFFYSTQVARLFRGFNENIYTISQAIDYLRTLSADGNGEI